MDAKREAALLQAEKKEQEKQAREEKKRQRQDKEAAYNEKYHNKGLSHSVEISYFSYSNTGEVVYRHSGYREYGSLYPVEADYTLSYKFGRAFSLGAGAGFFYNTKSLTIQGDDFAPMYGGSFKEKRWDIPIYANARLYLLRTAVRPVLSVSGGVYLMTGTLLLDYGGGLEVRIARRFSMTAALSGRTVPRPVFVNSDVGASASYKPCHALSVRLILSF